VRLSEIAGSRRSTAADRRFALLYVAWENSLPLREVDRPEDPEVDDLRALADAVRREGEKYETRTFGSNSPWRTAAGEQHRRVRRWPPHVVYETLTRLEKLL